MNLDNLDGDVVRDVNYLAEFIKRNRALVSAEQQRLGLEPRVLAHFNSWAESMILPLFSKLDLSLQPANRTIFCPDRKGFEIYLGEIQRNGQPIWEDFWDDGIYNAIQKYEKETPWVCNVTTHFDMPK